MNFQPSGDRLLVIPTKVEDTSKKSSLIIVEAESKAPIHGNVVAIGDEVKEGKFAIGDTIQFEMYAGKEVDVLGNKFLLVSIDKVEGKFSE